MRYRWIISLVLTLGLIFTPAMSSSAAPGAIVTAGGGGLSFLHGVTTVTSSGSVASGSFDATRVLCPPGMVAIGGGIDLGNVFTMVVSSSGPVYQQNNNRLLFQPDGANPAPVGWQASAVNHGAGTETYTVAAICAPISGVSSVVASDTAGAGSFGINSAACPVGTIAYSGGIDLGNVFTMTVSSSGPIFGATRLLFEADGTNPAPTGWQASGINNGAGSDLIKIAVICGQNPGVTTQVGSSTVGSHTFDAMRLTCPPSTIALGGGIDPNNVLTMQVSSSGPTFNQNNNRLLFQPNGNNPPPVGWQASILNNDTTQLPYKTAVICSLYSYRIYLPTIMR